jgi:3'-phosphoadenosine 5'-phosphosulfate sulfotransferase (PAPS reductase)/FAD synthetase
MFRFLFKSRVGRPIGTITHRKQGEFQKVGDKDWEAVAEPNKVVVTAKTFKIKGKPRSQCQPPPTQVPTLDYSKYDHILVMFSGGKDSLAALLHLIDTGCPREKIELWHHEIDEPNHTFMDWKCTPSYCKAVAKALGIKYFASRRIGGFKAELLKENKQSNPCIIEIEDENGKTQAIIRGGVKSKVQTRRKFPAAVADMRKGRWCTGSLKIDVARLAINNQPRFENKKTLYITGERWQESQGRGEYEELERHDNDAREGKLQRHIDHYRPVHKWTTQEVWAKIAEHKINPHPCYKLGWGRCSCAGCVFSGPNHWCSLRKVNPDQVNEIAKHENEFNHTISAEKLNVHERADKGTPFEGTNNPDWVAEANNENWDEPVILDDWKPPLGSKGTLEGPC